MVRVARLPVFADADASAAGVTSSAPKYVQALGAASPSCSIIMCSIRIMGCMPAPWIGSCTDGREIMGVVPPEYQTGWVYSALTLLVIISSVEFRAPACSPAVALLAPTGDVVGTDCREISGVVNMGTSGPYPYPAY